MRELERYRREAREENPDPGAVCLLIYGSIAIRMHRNRTKLDGAISFAH